MKNSTGFIIGAVILLLVVAGFLFYQKNNMGGSAGQDGSLYVGVTDATADIRNVNEIDLSVKKVELHSQSQGWVAVSSTEKKFALMSLKANGRTELYAVNNKLKSGTYDRLRVTLGDATVHTKDRGDVKATLPSRQVVMNAAVNIKSGSDSHVKLDFLADKSLHSTSDGAYVFATVLKAESRSGAGVTVSPDNSEKVSGGNVDAMVNVGVDLNGESRSNFELTTDNTLKVGPLVGSQVNFILGGKSYTSDDSKIQENVNVNGSVENTLNLNGTVNGTLNGSVNGNVNGSSTINPNSVNGGLDTNLNVKY